MILEKVEIIIEDFMTLTYSYSIRKKEKEKMYGIIRVY